MRGVDDMDAADIAVAGGALKRDLTQARAVDRLLSAAMHGVPSITEALAVTPTYSQSASATLSALSVSVGNANLITPIGGPIALQTAPQYRIQGMSTGVGAPTRRNGHGAGISFGLYGQVPELGANFNGVGWTMYVTDFVTGKRVRVQANDYSDTTGYRYHAIDFGSAGYRGIEVYNNAAGNAAGTFGVVNVGSGASIFKWTRPEPKIGVLWDSWGLGTLNSGTNPAKLTVTDYFGAAMGVANVQSLSVGGTGFVATSSGTELKYRDRVVLGDFDHSRIGNLDLLLVSGSLNDYVLGGNTSAATAAEIALVLPLLRIAQPKALIALTGPEWTPVNNIPQSWYDAHSAAFTVWADPNSVYLDNSPSGENWLNANINSVAFTGSVNHVNSIGASIYGSAMANSLISAIRARFAA